MDLRLVPKSNRKPADELADIRDQIKVLSEREQLLRSQMIAGRVDLIGDEFKVAISTSKSERIDATKIKRELGLNFLRPYLKVTESIYVRLKKLNGKEQA